LVTDKSFIVLAGGKGTRLRRYKALETINNEGLIQRVVSSLSFFNSDIIVVIGKGQRLPQFTDYPKLRIVTDAYAGKGPLVGIYTGLLASASSYNLVVACDMPFLNLDLLGYMLKISAAFDMVIPRLGGLVEPLHAVYAKSCLAAIEQLLGQGNYKTDQLLDLVKVRYVEAGEIDRFDPEHLSFFNINTRADWEVARELVKRVPQPDSMCPPAITTGTRSST
jgi:molybdopterin-guanine dinucleotide biosynthesis protein A